MSGPLNTEDIRSEMNTTDERCDSVIMIRVTRSLKGKVVARARLKERSTSDWCRIVLARHVAELEREKPREP